MRLISYFARSVIISSMVWVCASATASQKFGFHQSCGVLDMPLNLNVSLEVADKNAQYGVNIIYRYSDRVNKDVIPLYPQLSVYSSIRNNNSNVVCANGCGYASAPSVDKGQSKYNAINAGGNSGTVYNVSVLTENAYKSKSENITLPTRRLALLRIEGFIIPGSLGRYEKNQYSRLVGVYGAAFYEPLIIEYVETDMPGVMRLSQQEYGNSRAKGGYPVPEVSMNIGRKNSLNILMRGVGSTGHFDVPSSFSTTEWSVIPDCVK